MKEGRQTRVRSLAHRIRSSPNARGSVIIGLSMSVAGVGYFVFGLLPGTKYASDELSVLSVWQAVSFGFGLIVASPLNGVVYNELLRANGNTDDEGYLRSFRAVVVTGMVTAMLLLGVLCGTNRLFGGDILLAALAAVSVAIQVVAAIQRAVFSALGRWGRFSIQFLVEGVGRVVLSWVVVHFSDSLRLLILVNVGSQVLSIACSGNARHWLPRIHAWKPADYGLVARSVLPYLLAGFTVQSALSMTPFYGRTLASLPASGVAALGGLVQVLRVPTTLTVAIVMPRIRRGSQFFLDGDRRGYMHLLKRTVQILTSLWLLYGIVIAFLLHAVASRFTYGTELSPLVLVVAAGVCVLRPVSTYLHSAFMFHRRFNAASMIWGIGLAVFLLTCLLGRRSTAGVLVAVTASLGLASVALYRANASSALHGSREDAPDSAPSM